jgi:hypothetical protein
MALAGLGRSGMAGMAMRVIHDLDHRRGEGERQFFSDPIFDGHGLEAQSLREAICQTIAFAPKEPCLLCGPPIPIMPIP